MTFNARTSIDEQNMVLTEALIKFTERNNTYKDLWKEDGVIGTLDKVRHKTARIRRHIESILADREPGGPVPLGENDSANLRDDAIDLINYVCFLLRNLDAGRWDPRED